MLLVMKCEWCCELHLPYSLSQLCFSRMLVPDELTRISDVMLNFSFSRFCERNHMKSRGIKGAGSRNRKQTCYLYYLHCCPHVAIILCTDFGGWGESKIKLLLKIH